ncbi:MAG: radical SAM protein [Candidatus Eremiobacteraeota bacterium]|nr:radical SAM protein [Candidatus Eremiobacteraeota bacterium]MCW5872533.1 radical SAM protein [Candidatus Eremiobacteraeota bacterium]
MRWDLYYRGSLSSCNYSCGYCPFAKTRNTRSELARDRRQLLRFQHWTARQTARLGILFTPWGEALGHRAYRRTLIELSHQPNLERVAIQTNLSAPLQELAEASPRLALWATYHPGQTSLQRFAAQCARLDDLNIGYSVGMVGLKEHFADLTRLRQLLPPERYLWINAYKRRSDYYTAADIDFLKSIDPYFNYNLHRYPSFNTACQAGHRSFAVDGEGNLRRCHFVGEVLGNIYESDFARHLKPRLCPNQTCGCYIGYIHRPVLQWEQRFGPGYLERIPKSGSAVNLPEESSL